MELFAKYILPVIVIAVFLAVAAVISMFREKRIVDRKLDEIFSGRERLDPESFYENYFRNLGIPRDIVIRVREFLEGEFGYDLSRLSAEDDLTGNLSVFFEHDSLVDVEIVMRLEEEFGISIEDDEAEKAKTIRDIVELVSRKAGELREP